VTRLSPYIRYGVLSLAEIRDYVMNRVQHQDEATKSSTNWVGAITGNGCMLSWDDIWKDTEPYKTGYSTEDYAQTLPDDISSGTTGRVCIDSFPRLAVNRISAQPWADG